MAEMDWTRPLPQREAVPSLLSRVPKVIDWEAGITLFLLLGAVSSVAFPLEQNGWSRNMPPITTVAVISVVVAMLLARSRISMLLAWPLSLLAGAAVVAWQTLSMAGPGTLEQRIDAVYYRFGAWFDVISSDRVTNDSLPFNVLVLGITWLGVFLFGWSVYRWHNAWLGLIPGGIALFLDLVLVGDDLTGAIVLYMLFGFLLVMQTNLLANLHRWRREGASYPPMINISFLHFSAWALIGLMAFAWIVPAGPFRTPAPVQSLVERTLEFGTDFVRLAGPLHSKKVIPIHSYSGVLPFQGSVKLGDRELLAVTITDPNLQGPLLLRGSIYDEYEGGGWTTGQRESVPLPNGQAAERSIRRDIEAEELGGTLVPLHVELEAKSVVGTVVFSPGEPVSVSRNLEAEIPEGAARRINPDIDRQGRFFTDEELLSRYVPDDSIGVGVERDELGRVEYIEIVSLNELGLLEDTVGLDPGERIKRNRSYEVSGFISDVLPEDLRFAGTAYPNWIRDQYTELPDSLPERVPALAAQVVAGQPDNPYDKAKALEAYLREYQIDYNVEDVPPGRDAVDYFLFDSRRGYFDYHASAMVVMLRTLGVPSRLAVGFVTDENDIDPETGAYVVRDKNSYAWPEVYFPGHGWVQFNPTPDRPEELRPTERILPLGGDPGQVDDLLDLLPVSGADQAFFPPEDSELAPESGPVFISPGDGGNYSPLVTVGVLAFVGAVGTAVFVGWQRAVAGLPYPQQLWEKTIRLGSWAGVKPLPGQTPHDYARKLSKRFRDVEDWPVLADEYTRSRFGRKNLTEDSEQRLKDLWPDARGALIGGLFGRFFHRKRPSDE
jgi:transglutaminase-like putative cysteine protease